jgi:hypothetical protein
MTTRANAQIAWDAADTTNAIATVEGWTALPAGAQVILTVETDEPIIMPVTEQAGIGTVDEGGNIDLTPASAPPADRVLDSVDPIEGTKDGGTLVTLTGHGLTGIAGVTFDGQPATELAIADDTTATCVTPPGGQGAVDVQLVDGELGSPILPAAFSYT